MAKIKIQRASKYANKIRDYKIFIDGQNVGTISDGETKEFEVMPGKRTVTAKIDWCCSPDFVIDVSANETKCLEVDMPQWAEDSPIYYITFGRKEYLRLSEVE